jgi:hypothetical protein
MSIFNGLLLLFIFAMFWLFLAIGFILGKTRANEDEMRKMNNDMDKLFLELIQKYEEKGGEQE